MDGTPRRKSSAERGLSPEARSPGQKSRDGAPQGVRGSCVAYAKQHAGRARTTTLRLAALRSPHGRGKEAIAKLFPGAFRLARMSRRGCLKSKSIHVIARSVATKQSSSCSLPLDCFATLAMPEALNHLSVVLANAGTQYAVSVVFREALVDLLRLPASQPMPGGYGSPRSRRPQAIAVQASR